MGGPVEGRREPQVGARDPSPPRADEPCVLPHRLGFYGSSTVWGPGGVCFVDAVVDPDAGTLGRRYLITHEQFQDVLAQESNRPVGETVDLGPVLATGAYAVGDGRYDLALSAGEVAGAPVLTFTSPTPVSELTPNPPSPAYAQTIIDGLVESHGMSSEQARDYIAARVG